MTGDTWGCCIMAHLRTMEIERIDVAYQGNQYPSSKYTSMSRQDRLGVSYKINICPFGSFPFLLQTVAILITLIKRIQRFCS